MLPRQGKQGIWVARLVSFRSLRYAIHRALGLKTTRIEGLLVICDPAKINPDVARAIIRGTYELAERVLARAAIRPGDKVLEIGTGVGVVGLLCTQFAGAGNVTSYEANAALAPTIAENFALNGLTPNLRLKAVTADGGPVTFFRNANVVSSSMVDRKLAADQITVDSDPINQALQDTGAAVIVMDVEGAEIDLLRAADLSGVREIIVEVHPHIMGEVPTQAMVDDLCNRGFSVKQRQHKTVWLRRT